MFRYVALCVAVFIGIVVLFQTTAANGAAPPNCKQTHCSWVSWYGPGLYGNHMACGGVLSTSTWGVAHKYLPCGTRVRMCYRKCVTVVVKDRGPFVAGRDFDLTFPVVKAVGATGGVFQVRWWIVK